MIWFYHVRDLRFSTRLRLVVTELVRRCIVASLSLAEKVTNDSSSD